MKLIAAALLTALVSTRRIDHQELAQVQSRFVAEPTEYQSELLRDSLAQEDADSTDDKEPKEKKESKEPKVDNTENEKKSKDVEKKTTEDAPKEEKSKEAPKEEKSEKAPKEEKSEKAPKEEKSEKAPKEEKGEKAPKEKKSSEEDTKEKVRPSGDTEKGPMSNPMAKKKAKKEAEEEKKGDDESDNKQGEGNSTAGVAEKDKLHFFDFDNREIWDKDYNKYLMERKWTEQNCELAESDNWKGPQQCTQSWECRGARVCERGGWCTGYDGCEGTPLPQQSPGLATDC